MDLLACKATCKSLLRSLKEPLTLLLADDLSKAAMPQTLASPREQCDQASNANGSTLRNAGIPESTEALDDQASNANGSKLRNVGIREFTEQSEEEAAAALQV